MFPRRAGKISCKPEGLFCNVDAVCLTSDQKASEESTPLSLVVAGLSYRHRVKTEARETSGVLDWISTSSHGTAAALGWRNREDRTK